MTGQAPDRRDQPMLTGERAVNLLSVSMVYRDEMLLARLRPHLKRVMVLDGAAASARMLTELLKDVGVQRVNLQANDQAGLAALAGFNPQLVFTELSGPGLDGLGFTRALRRSSLACRQIPVIVATAESTAAAILGARQAGVHEFLRKPYAINDITRRLDAAILRPREWIEAIGYVGPDRRRFNSGDYTGPRKRRADHPRNSDQESITQALNILRSAIDAIDSDPVQALRSMRAQVLALHNIALGASNLRLLEAAAVLHRCLIGVVNTGSMERHMVVIAAQGLWAFLPAKAAVGSV